MRSRGEMDDRAELAPSGRAVFERGLEQYQRGLQVFARNLLGNAEEACDIVQETFVDAWRATLREQPPFVGGCGDADVRRWLYHVAYQRAISARRRRMAIAWESLDVDVDVDVAEPAEPAASAGRGAFEERLAESDALRLAFACLAPEDAACVALKIVQGFAATEIARMLDITPEAARQRLSRALRRLRDAYAAQNRPEPQAGGTRLEVRIRQ